MVSLEDGDFSLELTSIIIAIVAICVSMFTAGWTVYREAIQRPKFRVSIAIKSVYQAGHEPIGPDIFVEVLNLGPLPNRLGLVWCRKSWWQRRVNPTKSLAHIASDYGHIATTTSGERIEVGDTGTHVSPYNVDCFLNGDWSQVGVTDGYGRNHWAPRKQLREAREQYRREFPQEGPLGN